MEFKVTKLSKISNAIFLLFTLFLLSFIWIEFYLNKIKLSLIISIPISLSLYLIYYQIKKYLEKRREQKQTLKQTKESIVLQLCLGKESIINNYLLNIFNYQDTIEINSNHYILDKTKDIVFSFDRDTLTESTFNSIIRKRHNDSIIIFCTESKVSYRPKGIDIEIVDINAIQQKTLESSIPLPSTVELKKQPKYSLKDILCIVFNKGKSLRYFYTSILLIFASLFTPFTNYYIIISSLLLIAAIYSRLNTRFN